MNDSRAKTLAALDTFLDSQRDLITRTQSDLHKLTQLRERALEDPESFVENVETELDDPAFRLSEYDPPQIPEGVDWDLFACLDPSPLANIPTPDPPLPSTKQLSPPSDLQVFVRDAAKNILGDIKPFDLGLEDDDHESKADERRLVELVQSGKHATQAPHAADIDVAEPPAQRRRLGSGLRLKLSSEALDSHTFYDSKSRLGAREKRHNDVIPLSPTPLQQRPKRTRKPRLRPDEIYCPPPPPSPSPELPPFPDTPIDSAPISAECNLPVEGNSDSSTDVESDKEEMQEPPLTPSRTNSKRQKTRNRKAPSETFNLPWSLPEQHLLEKLLDEIPSGEKQRWAKISKAMAGKRTPRQVASRVQKYFEKLKKFGIDPD